MGTFLVMGTFKIFVGVVDTPVHIFPKLYASGLGISLYIKFTPIKIFFKKLRSIKYRSEDSHIHVIRLVCREWRN